MSEREVFKVDRRAASIFGWFCVALAGIVLILSVIEGNAPMLFGSLFGVTFGLPFIQSARNVNKIIVDERSITFLPVNAELLFSDIDEMFVPSWADRFDTPPNYLVNLTLKTNTQTKRYVAGAVFQYRDYSRINFQGCDGNRMLAVLRQHIPWQYI